MLLRLIDRISRRMRRAGRVGRTVTLRFRFDDFSRATRSHSLPQHTAGTRTVHATAVALLDAAWPMIGTRGLTLLGVSVGNLQNADAVQLTLPFERADLIQLEAAVDAVRDRFGSASLTSAGSIGTDAGFTMPMLPD